MTAKEFLKRYARAKDRAELFKAEYRAELETVDTIRSAGDGDGTPRSGKVSDPTKQKALRLAEKLTNYEQAEMEALEIRIEIFKAISLLPVECGQVLFERYLERKSWTEVADSICYSLTQTHRFHRQALLLLQHDIE